ncbi:MAG: periplasmic heavy metal sensor [Candidatus Thiodiazotropha sp. (ex Cardiolucina cf. quadrata)]|nr:periplasmic heavy metal sensor [Candidatus Thiodiazotropha sp. (ex Cardiolucina cf. quadrata)]
MGKILIITLVVVVALLISGVAIARYKGYCAGPEGRIGWMTDRIGRQLDLDDSQQQYLAQLKDRIVLSANELRRDRSTYVDQAIGLLESSEFDREKARTLLMQKQAQLASLSSDVIDAFADFSNNLNQSQRDKLQSMIMHHREHRHCKFACGDSKQLTQE